MKTTEQKIKETESKLKQLKQELIENHNDKDFIKIPELNIEIQKSIHHKNKSYDDLIKEFGEEYLEKHLPTYSQLQFLRNSDKYINKLELKDTWEFVKQEDLISKKNGYVARFIADSDCVNLNTYRVSGNSYSGLGVRFVRPIRSKK